MTAELSIADEAHAVVGRLQQRAARALMISRNEAKPQIIRDLCAAYLDVHRNHLAYLHAAFQNPDVKRWVDAGDDHKAAGFFQRFSIADFVVNIPAMWEFDFTIAIGTINDANWCAHQYKWVKFIGVKPLHPDYPLNGYRIPIFHKPNSRFRIGYEGRKRMKADLGSKYRSLVNFARKSTKTDFLYEFNQPPPNRTQQTKVVWPSGMVSYQDNHPYKSKRCVHIEAAELLRLSGYHPDEFWREAKQPGTVPSRRPRQTFLL